jgi:rhamnogalacturonan endolyase
MCGTSSTRLTVTVNGVDSGILMLRPVGDNVIVRHGSQGIWYETAFTFDATLLKQGTNTMTITVPAGPVNDGVMYDYLRLEF